MATKELQINSRGTKNTGRDMRQAIAAAAYTALRIFAAGISSASVL